MDTCALLWIADEVRLARGAVDELNAAARHNDVTMASPITAWEIGLLVARRRLAVRIDPVALFRRCIDRGRVALAMMSPEILVDSSFLPGTPPRDPAVRLIAATARANDLTLITRDRPLLAYAEAGHLKAIAC